VAVTVLEDAARDRLAAWDALVAGTPGTDVSQLSAWARVRATAGYRALHVLASEDGDLVAGAQVLHRHVPALGRLAYVPYGPVVSPRAAGRDDVRRALAAALSALARERLRAVFVQPPDGGAEMSRELAAHGFRRSEVGILPAASLRLDLDAGEQELRGRLGRRLRSWTNRWAASGVSVRRGGEGDVDLLAGLMVHTARRHGFSALPACYLRALYRELAPGGHVLLFVGEVHGRPVAADLLTGCGGVMRGRLTGFDRSGPGARLSVPGAMRWEAIRWARAHGYASFDFGGVSQATVEGLLAGRPRESPDWPSADRHKLSFGGEPYRYPPPVELIRPAPVRAAYDLVRGSQQGRRLVERASRLLRHPASAPTRP